MRFAMDVKCNQCVTISPKNYSIGDIKAEDYKVGEWESGVAGQWPVEDSSIRFL